MCYALCNGSFDELDATSTSGDMRQNAACPVTWQKGM